MKAIAARKFRSLSALCILAFAPLACRHQNSFHGNVQNAPKTPSAPVNSSAARESDAISRSTASPLASDLVVPCRFEAMDKSSSSEPIPPGVVVAAEQNQLLLSAHCNRNVVQKADPNRGLDLVFVLDVTGSMRSQLDLILSQFHEMVTALTAAGWNLHVGALAVADDVIDSLPLSANTDGTLASMGPQNAAWSALPGFGGDVPEQGLLGLQCALNLLSDDDSCDRASGSVPVPEHTVRDKAVVYVSDAPARDYKRRYSPSETAAKWKEYSALLNSSEHSSLQFFYAASASRRGLLDDMPTPSEQMAIFAKESGVVSHDLGFPLNAGNFKSEFLEKLSQGKLVVQSCQLNVAEILHEDGSSALPRTKIDAVPAPTTPTSAAQAIQTQFYAISRAKLGKGKFQLKMQYDCDGEIQNSSVSLTL